MNRSTGTLLMVLGFAGLASCAKTTTGANVGSGMSTIAQSRDQLDRLLNSVARELNGPGWSSSPDQFSDTPCTGLDTGPWHPSSSIQVHYGGDTPSVLGRFGGIMRARGFTVSDVNSSIEVEQVHATNPATGFSIALLSRKTPKLLELDGDGPCSSGKPRVFTH